MSKNNVLSYEQLKHADVRHAWRYGEEYFLRVKGETYWDNSMYRVNPSQRTASWLTILEWMEKYQDDCVEVDPSQLKL